MKNISRWLDAHGLILRTEEFWTQKLFSETPTQVLPEIVAPDPDAAAATTHSAAEPSVKEAARCWHEVIGWSDSVPKRWVLGRQAGSGKATKYKVSNAEYMIISSVFFVSGISEGTILAAYWKASSQNNINLFNWNNNNAEGFLKKQ